MIFKLFLNRFVLIYFSLLISSCKKADVSITETPLADSISLETFTSIPPPTFQQMTVAYDYITGKDSSIINKHSAYIKALFLWVKSHPNGTINRAVSPEIEMPSNKTLENLTYDEWVLIYWRDVREVMGGMYSRLLAYAAVDENFPCDIDGEFDDSKANAILHSYWNAMMVRNSGLDFAEKYGTAHESDSDPSHHNTQMDLHNNEFGRKIALKYPNATDDELLQILIRQKFLFIGENEPIPEHTEELVYITAKRPYDGTFTGTMTNPDSGGPWDASFDMSQCGTLIRGQFTIIRGQEKQIRRFTGGLNSSGSMSLNVSDPYVFENPRGLYFCAAFVISVTGTSSSLTGKWTSSNCNKGGTLELKR